MTETYQAQLQDKTARVSALLSEFTAHEPQVYQSPEQHYRMRAEFRVWHEGDTLNYVMFPKGQSNAPYIVKQFEAASDTINKLMPLVLDYARDKPALRTRLFQADFLSNKAGDCVLSLIYHRKLDEQWVIEAKNMGEALNVSIIGRSRKQKLVIDKDYITETFNVAGNDISYQQIENSFSQPNAYVNEHMLNWAHDAASGLGDDLLELYCGNGNFTLALASQFNKAMATEVSKSSIASARKNAAINGKDNITIVRLSAAEVSQALSHVREFRRLEDVDIDAFSFSTVFVDPPRAGIDDETLAFIAQFSNIIYVSCNPNTLQDNLRSLTKTHYIDKLAIFDQFPFTDHVESGVLLRKTKQE